MKEKERIIELVNILNKANEEYYILDNFFCLNMSNKLTIIVWYDII